MIGQAQANGVGFARAFENGVGVLVGAKIMMEASRPLGAGQLAFGQLAMNYLIQGGMMASLLGGGQRFVPEPQAQWSASLNGEHTGTIDLGDGYTLRLDERESEITIHNAETGETTRIWGDPHVDVDGKRAFDFWGTTTFTLENGTKITIDTEQWRGNPNEYVASQLTITKGDQAIVVDGISQNKLGDLEVTMSNNGRALDRATRDGFVLNENATGAGWRSDLTGRIATQADLNATKAGQPYGPGSTMPSFDEIRQALSTFLFFGIAAGMADSFGGGDSAPVGRPFFRPIEL